MAPLITFPPAPPTSSNGGASNGREWEDWEDDLLKDSVEDIGKKWTQIAQRLPGDRTPASCRNRFSRMQAETTSGCKVTYCSHCRAEGRLVPRKGHTCRAKPTGIVKRERINRASPPPTPPPLTFSFSNPATQPAIDADRFVADLAAAPEQPAAPDHPAAEPIADPTEPLPLSRDLVTENTGDLMDYCFKEPMTPPPVSRSESLGRLTPTVAYKTSKEDAPPTPSRATGSLPVDDLLGFDRFSSLASDHGCLDPNTCLDASKAAALAVDENDLSFSRFPSNF